MKITTPIHDPNDHDVIFADLEITLKGQEASPVLKFRSRKRGTLTTFKDASVGDQKGATNEKFDKAISAHGELMNPTRHQYHRCSSMEVAFAFPIPCTLKVSNHLTHQKVPFHTIHHGKEWWHARFEENHVGACQKLLALREAKVQKKRI